MKIDAVASGSSFYKFIYLVYGTALVQGIQKGRGEGVHTPPRFVFVGKDDSDLRK